MQDDRVCFPAGTLITTQQGQKTIDEIQIGEMVLTRKGFRKVVSISNRLYSGDMVTIQHQKGQLTSTLDHPIWKSGKGWVSASQIQSGDFLETVDNKESRVSTVLQFKIRDPNNSPPIISQETVFLSITSQISMPVNSINFQSYSILWNQKVNTISSHSGFLNILDFRFAKNLFHMFFRDCFSFALMVTRKTTELPILLRRYNSETPSTSFACNKLRRSPAFFTAIMSVQTFFSAENLSTSFTRHIFSPTRSTLSTANTVPISNRTVNSKCLSTFWTNFFNLFSCKTPTFKRTKLFSSFRSVWNKIKSSAALRTDFVFPRPSSLRQLCFHLLRGYGHNDTTDDTILDVNHSLCAKYINVYNLQIEDDPTFFANGILVHNCPICRGIDGYTWIFEVGVDVMTGQLVHPSHGVVWDLTSGSQAHGHKGNCRCSLTHEINIQDLIAKVEEIHKIVLEMVPEPKGA